MKLNMKPVGLLLTLGALSLSSAKAELLAYFNFNNVILESGSIGVFLDSGVEEVYHASAHTISPASAGIKADDAMLDLSAFDGEMGGVINGGTSNWGAYFGTILGAVDGFEAGGALALGSGLNGKPVVISLNTEGIKSLLVTFAVRSSGENGATQINWEVSSDGTSYQPAGSTTLFQDNTYTEGAINLSAFKEMENAQQAYIRFAFDGTTGNGNVRIDNIQVSGTKAQ